MIGHAQALRIAPPVVMLALTIRGSAQVIPTADAPPGPRTGMIVGQVVDAATGESDPRGHRYDDVPKYFAESDCAERPRDGGRRRPLFLHGSACWRVLPASARRTAMRPARTASAGRGARACTCLSPRASGSRTSRSRSGNTASSPAPLWTKPANRSSASRCGRSSRDVFAGRPRYGTMQVISELVPIATTDDRGMFRLSQLMPGHVRGRSCLPRRPRAGRVRWSRPGLRRLRSDSLILRASPKCRCSGSLARNKWATLPC